MKLTDYAAKYAACLAAVKQSGYALRYVDLSFFKKIITIDGRNIELSNERFEALKQQLLKD